MATIGHTLVGFMLAEPRGSSRRGWPSAAWWPGMLILGSHLPDVAEWVLVMLGLQNERSHQFHTLKGATALTLGGWVLLLVLGVRRLWALALWAAAVWSHLLLDNATLGHEIRSWYRDPPFGQEIAARGLDPAAEIWFFGAPLMLTALGLAVWRNWSTARSQETPGPGRLAIMPAGGPGGDELVDSQAKRSARRWQLPLCLIPIVMITWFIPGIRLAWPLAYLIAALVAMWSLQLEPKAKWLFNLIPLMPVIGLGMVEVWSGMLMQRAAHLEFSRDYAQAAAMYRRSALLPTRSDKAVRWWGVGRCFERAGDAAAAEAAYKSCVDADTEWHWSRVILAKLYLRTDTPLYRPAAAERLLKDVLADPVPEYAREAARQQLERIGGPTNRG